MSLIPSTTTAHRASVWARTSRSSLARADSLVPQQSPRWTSGGGDLAGQFLDAGALDEVALSVAPVALTGGAPLLPRRLESDRLRLVRANAVGQFARLVYAVLPQP